MITVRFKKSPCKVEDFIALAESLSFKTDALFMRHVNTRWLTLTPAPELVLKRWDDCKKYFLDYVPNKKEYKATIPKNKRYQEMSE